MIGPILKQGDFMNLEVIVYSKSLGNCNECKNCFNKDGLPIVSLYTTPSLSNYFKKMESLGELEEEISAEARKIGETINYDKPIQRAFIIRSLIGSEDALFNLFAENETILDAGAHSNCYESMKRNVEGAIFYFRTKAAMQAKRRPRKLIMQYFGKNSDKFGKVLMSKYILPLTSPLSFGNKEKLEKELLEVGKIHGIELQTKKIIEALNNDNDKLVRLYVDQALAVHEENYEQAAKLRDEIAKAEINF